VTQLLSGIVDALEGSGRPALVTAGRDLAALLNKLTPTAADGLFGTLPNAVLTGLQAIASHPAGLLAQANTPGAKSYLNGLFASAGFSTPAVGSAGGS
jgi:hypothetical protein